MEAKRKLKLNFNIRNLNRIKVEKLKQRIYVCDGTIDGIFTAIYKAWESKYGHNNIKIIENDFIDTMELFSDYIFIEADGELAGKVSNTIIEKLTIKGYELAINGCLSKEKGRSDSVYRFLLLGLSIGPNVLEQMAHPYVNPIYKMYTNICNELQHYRGFLRFQELSNGILSAKVCPENNLLTLLAEHFVDRFPNENWLIIDEGRQIAAIHKKEKGYIIADSSFISENALNEFSKEEETMQQIWKCFVDTIGIKERKNNLLRQQMLPKRFRKYMNEFNCE